MVEGVAGDIANIRAHPGTRTPCSMATGRQAWRPQGDIVTARLPGADAGFFRVLPAPPLKTHTGVECTIWACTPAPKSKPDKRTYRTRG